MIKEALKRPVSLKKSPAMFALYRVLQKEQHLLNEEIFPLFTKVWGSASLLNSLNDRVKVLNEVLAGPDISLRDRVFPSLYLLAVHVDHGIRVWAAGCLRRYRKKDNRSIDLATDKAGFKYVLDKILGTVV